MWVVGAGLKLVGYMHVDWFCEVVELDRRCCAPFRKEGGLFLGWGLRLAFRCLHMFLLSLEQTGDALRFLECGSLYVFPDSLVTCVAAWGDAFQREKTIADMQLA